MELTKQLGEEIIARLSQYIDVPVNLMDPSGKIVASTDDSRLYQLHGGAQNVIESQEPQIIHDDDVERLSNVKPGVNLPIFHRGFLAGVVGLTGNPDEVMQAAGMTRGSVEIALEQIYIQRQAFYQERQWNNWVQQLLHPIKMDEDYLLNEATYTLGVNVNVNWQVVILHLTNHFEWSERVRQILNTQGYQPLFVVPHQEYEVIVAFPHEGKTIVVEEVFKELEGTNVSVGVGGYEYGLAGLRRSYFQAVDAIKLGRDKFSYSEQVQMKRLLYHIDPMIFEELTKEYQTCLGKLEDIYVATLECYFASNLKVNRTSADMHIHRNTLVYRLEQVHKKVGLDPRVFKDAIILQALLVKN
ncbi:helix-turn-helix domain-containing protein [Halobacillus shinanisalinarum]|uniref:Helix-turn-helix domain-containing protein n=1 Tax=Halobacillus shinanisalinarum TaxID=2932258 RepID=A0ABY4GX03_9BACI|nr:sugar diacid recognition domain-containing protein [Halobacillus shinanisalinarum]UOQ92459.1 helix-turn-helix domain-containing protein [Halobacillus shinanisalinarum]